MQTQSQISSDRKWMGVPSSMQICIQNCLDCFQVCSQTLTYCLEKSGKHAESQHIKLLGDCARICNLSADFMIRHSDYHASSCEVCAEICTACAISCDSFSDDEMMKACADICRKCAASCEDMAKKH